MKRTAAWMPTNATSSDTIELIMEVEDQLNISISDKDVETIQTVGEAIDYIKRMERPEAEI